MAYNSQHFNSIIITNLLGFSMQSSKSAAAMFDSVEERPFPFIAVGPKEMAFLAFHLVTLEVSFIDVAITPFDDAAAIFLAAYPLTYILFGPVSESQFPSSMSSAV